MITHGNGPQVGNHLLRSEIARTEGGLPELPLDVCVADTQGGMGYMLQQSLTNAFHEAGSDVVVASLVTQVVVDEDDPAFDKPAKPIGEMVDEKDVAGLEAGGWTLKHDEQRGGWRRVVASPDPVEVVEAAAIRALVASGAVVVAAGGGGVPVVSTTEGLRGRAAVVDKDLASALLAADLRADALVILTDVTHVARSYGTPAEEPISELTVTEARRLLAKGEFGEGSMAPKVDAMCRFIERSGGSGVIASIDQAAEALDGIGTRFIR